VAAVLAEPLVRRREPLRGPRHARHHPVLERPVLRAGLAVLGEHRLLAVVGALVVVARAAGRGLPVRVQRRRRRGGGERHRGAVVPPLLHAAVGRQPHQGALGDDLVAAVLEAVAARGVGQHDGLVHVEV